VRPEAAPFQQAGDSEGHPSSHPHHLVVAGRKILPLKCSSKILQRPNRVDLTSRMMTWRVSSTRLASVAHLAAVFHEGHNELVPTALEIP